MNGNKILQKCIDELKGEDPEIKYVLGMLEALLEMQLGEKKVCETVPGTTHRSIPPSPSIKDTEVKTNEMDEGKILEENMKANLNKVDLSAVKTE